MILCFIILLIWYHVVSHNIDGFTAHAVACPRLPDLSRVR